MAFRSNSSARFNKRVVAICTGTGNIVRTRPIIYTKRSQTNSLTHSLTHTLASRHLVDRNGSSSVHGKKMKLFESEFNTRCEWIGFDRISNACTFSDLDKLRFSLLMVLFCPISREQKERYAIVWLFREIEHCQRSEFDTNKVSVYQLYIRCLQSKWSIWYDPSRL